MKKIVIIIVLLLTASGLGYYLYRWNQNRPGVTWDGKLTSVAYFYGGGEYGDAYELFLKSEDGKLHYEKTEGNGQEKIEKYYKVRDKEIYEQLEAVIEKYGLAGWGELPKAETYALDSSYATLNISYDGISIRCNTEYDELPEGGYAAVKEIREILEKIIDQK